MISHFGGQLSAQWHTPSADCQSGESAGFGNEQYCGSTNVVVVAGHWDLLENNPAVFEVTSTVFHRCRFDRAELHDLVVRVSPKWLILGAGIDDALMVELTYMARVLQPSLHLGVLGPAGNSALAERWLRRGCLIYFTESTPVNRLLRALKITDGDLVVVDPLSGLFFQPTVPLVAALTEREDEVLKLVRRGLRSDMIADKLSISIRTVEYHLRKIYYKLGVGNRVEAVVRAAELGL
ncbi:response regulator transcription factor [Nocardia sp. NPDC051570]|uniref:response regulator transcription factor n=1 Tax=Nocardia sp. NPDC051570 TaxID=3364324 RepID=UPI0037AFFE1C